MVQTTILLLLGIVGTKRKKFIMEKISPASDNGYLILLAFAPDLPNDAVALPVLLFEALRLLGVFLYVKQYHY